MADFETIKTEIQTNIDTNGNQEITGAILQDTLLGMVDATEDNITELEQELGSYADDEEFVRTYIDNEGKFLFGIRKDGSVDWSNGIPLPVQKYVDNIIRSISEEIEEKAGKFETSQEFIRILTDADGNILEALRKDGVKDFYGFIDTLPLTDKCIKSLSKILRLDSYLSAVTNAHNNNIVLFDEYGKIKDSGYSLRDLPNGLPTGGSNGEVLRTDGNGGYYWSSVPTTTITDVSQTFGVLVDQYENLNHGVSWAKAIQRAVDIAGEGGTIVFTPNKTYPIDQTINVKANQVFIGNNATIFRMNESKAIVAAEVIGDGVNNTIQFDSVPEDWKSENADWSGARVYLFSESEGRQGRYLGSFKFRSINGNVVTCRNIQGVGDEVDVFNYSIPEGTIAVRSYNLFSGGQTNPNPYKVYNLNFNGNKANNSSLIYWGVNNTIHIYSRGSVIDSCRFIDIPTENIVTQGSIIQNCYAKNLNGSFIHLSCPPRNILADGVDNYMGTFVTNNFCENIMIYDESILGHNTAPVTYSWNPGKLVVIGNQFYGNNTSKCILMDAFTPDEPTSDAEAGDMRYAVYIGNIYVNFPKIGDIPLVSDNVTKISTRLITNNIFRNCGSSDMKRLYQTELKFEDNLYDGNTKVDTNGNSLMYRIDRELNSIPSSAVLTEKYTNLPNGGLVYVSSIEKLYRKIQISDTITKWIDESITYLN